MGLAIQCSTGVGGTVVDAGTAPTVDEASITPAFGISGAEVGMATWWLPPVRLTMMTRMTTSTTTPMMIHWSVRLLTACVVAQVDEF